MRLKLPAMVWAILLVPALLLILFTLPITLPIVAWLDARDKRRRLTASWVACHQCGAMLGPEALARSDATWAEWLANVRREHPGWRMRVVRRVWAVCGRCGAEYGFDEEHRAFIPAEPGWSAPQPVPPSPDA